MKYLVSVSAGTGTGSAGSPLLVDPCFLVLPVSSSGHCPHRSVPVEMDESMTCSSLDLVLPPACQQCLCSARTHQQQQQQQRQHGYQQTQRPGPGDHGFYLESGAAPPGGLLLRLAQQNPHPAHLQPRGGGAAGGPGYHQHSSPYSHHGPVEDEDQSLERPLPLVSNSNQGHWVQAQHPAAPPPGQWWETWPVSGDNLLPTTSSATSSSDTSSAHRTLLVQSGCEQLNWTFLDL